MAPSSVIIAALMSAYAYAQSQQVQFNQVVNLNGDMNINELTFPDNTVISTFSQSQRQIIVNQNPQPVNSNQVTGSTGGPFVGLNQNSLVIQTNGATDLVGGQIELPMNMQMMQQNNINPDNTFVAKLSDDRQAWQIMETLRSVNVTSTNTRMVKLNQLDGEYQILGRQNPETNLALLQFTNDPQDQQNTFNVTGAGIQESEFTDGFRMSIRSTMPMTVQTNVINGISTSMLPGTAKSVNNFRYAVTTNLGGVLANVNRQQAVVQLPVNAVKVQQLAQASGVQQNSGVTLSIQQRGILNNGNPGGAVGGQLSGSTGTTKRQNSGTGTTNNPAATNLLLSPTFTPITNQAVLDSLNGRVAVPVQQVDGEFIITMDMGQTQGGVMTSSTGQTAGSANQTTGQAVQPGVSVPGASVAQPGLPASNIKRQAPAPGTVFMTMQQINDMAAIQTRGAALAVTELMSTLGPYQGSASSAQPALGASMPSSSIPGGLAVPIKKRSFQERRQVQAEVEAEDEA